MQYLVQWASGSFQVVDGEQLKKDEKEWGRTPPCVYRLIPYSAPEKVQKKPIPAIYVYDTKETPYAMWIVEGRKRMETRSRNVLRNFVGKRVLVIRTRSGHKAEVVGEVTLSLCGWLEARTLDENRNLTMIPKGSKYDIEKGGKWCYWLKDPVKYGFPVPLADYEIITRNMSYAIVNEY